MDDVIKPYMQTVDRHANEEDQVFHIPAYFGDDLTYQNAYFNFMFLEALGNLLERASLEYYGV